MKHIRAPFLGNWHYHAVGGEQHAKAKLVKPGKLHWYSQHMHGTSHYHVCVVLHDIA